MRNRPAANEVQMTTVSVPFGKENVEVEIPTGFDLTIAKGEHRAPLPDPEMAAMEAVMDPVGSLPLADLAKPGDRIVIAVTDATRECPDSLLVPPMLGELARAGVRDTDITILVAVGTHRASTDAEKLAKLGPEIVGRFRVVDHDPFDGERLAGTGVEVGGREVRLSRLVVEADLAIATGRVEPHQYAGYSGGGKTVAIGCAAEEVIQFTHGPAMLDQPGTRLGNLDSNPFQQAVREVAQAAKVRFVANCVIDDRGEIVAICYGDPFAVQDSLAAIAEPIYLAPLKGQADIAIAGVGFPKDENLYQATRAASYLQFGPVPAVRKGGVIIVPAACPEGAGGGIGEQRFAAAMAEHGGHASMLERQRSGAFLPGEQRAYVMARVLEDVTVLFAGLEDPAEAVAMGFEVAPTIDDALARAIEIVGESGKLLVAPHALLTVPVVSM